MPDRPEEQDLVAPSDALLDAVDDLKGLEREKRRVHISTPDFHQLAEEIEAKSRDVFRLAADERRLADRTETSDVSIDDVAEADLTHGRSRSGSGARHAESD
jgi:hypothetical protein